jgi:hypothetical protein
MLRPAALVKLTGISLIRLGEISFVNGVELNANNKLQRLKHRHYATVRKQLFLTLP